MLITVSGKIGIMLTKYLEYNVIQYKRMTMIWKGYHCKVCGETTSFNAASPFTECSTFRLVYSITRHL